MYLDASFRYTFLPSLARAIGLYEAILAGRLQALLLEEKDDPRFVRVDEKLWLVATYRSLRNREFPFLPLDTIRLSMQKLNQLGILISEQKPYAQAKNIRYWHHTIDHRVLADYSTGILSASWQLSRFRIQKENFSYFSKRSSVDCYQSRLTDEYLTSLKKENSNFSRLENWEEQE